MTLEYLAANRGRLALEGHDVSEDPAWVMITPRFRASSHVIQLILGEGTARPVLAVKTARLPGDSQSLDREAAHLRAIQASRPGGYDSIPRVVAYEAHRGHPVLVETALSGAPMDRARIRKDQSRCCQAMLGWLLEVQSATRTWTPDGRTRLIDEPLDRIAAVLAPEGRDERLLVETRAALVPLRDLPLALVFEHGDLSHPNLLLSDGGAVGVLDWETADPAGLPLCDLFFFLTYVAFARRGRWSRQGHVQAFHQAFWGPSAWTRPYVERYVERLGLPAPALLPLFLATWARYLAGLIGRLGESEAPRGSTGRSTAAWLRAHRFFALWRHTLAHADKLSWKTVRKA